ncbi:MAG: acylphosphatase, partial [Lachnospiraceae bacterium]|nr:acylphosphatase [Lachnospiraceae bacterium]
MQKSLEITVYGMVQGVGFRPFVAGLADEIGISGNVRNSGGIVHI